MRWEYKVADSGSVPSSTDAEAWLNGYGSDGWEMCGHEGPIVTFKRPLPPCPTCGSTDCAVEMMG